MGKPCYHFNRRCIDTRIMDFSMRRRRYICKNCGMRLTTVEVTVDNARSGRDLREDFENQYGDGFQNKQIQEVINLLESFIRED